MSLESEVGIIDLGPDAEGENFAVDGRYDAEVRSRVIESGPLCFYDEGEKIYIVKDGEFRSESVKGDYVVYELDLRGSGKSAQLNNPQVLRQVVEERRDQITSHRLETDRPYSIRYCQVFCVNPLSSSAQISSSFSPLLP